MIFSMNPKIKYILPKIAGVLAVLAISVIALAVFANSMTKSLGHDEQMYCTAAALVAQGRMIYRDFSYVAQMPYHPLLCAAIFNLLNTTHYLLTARIISSLCDIFIIICIIGIYYRAFGSSPAGLLPGLAGAVMYVFNPFVDYANGLAWNHDLITLCIVLSFWIFQTSDSKSKPGYWPVAVIAALLTLAACTRPTTILVQFLFFAALLIQRTGSVKQKMTIILLFLAVTAVFWAWPAWTILSAPRASFLNLLLIPLLNSRFLHQTGMFYGKSEMIFIFLTMNACFSLILMAVYLCAAVLWNLKKLKIPNKKLMIFACLLTIVCFIIAFIPLTTWPQYFAAPILLLIISFAYPLSYLRRLAGDRYFIIAVVLMIACAFTTIGSNFEVFERIPQLLTPRSWVPIQVHNISQDIVGRAKSPKLALTLSPLYAIEGGCEIYTEFSAGPFVYRIADDLSPSDRRLLNAVGSESLGELPKNHPPSVMILGLEPKFLEVPFFRHIKPDKETWDVKIYDNGPMVYFRR